MYHLGTWFCGQLGSGGLTVGPDDLRGFFQTKQFCDSMPSPALEETESHAVAGDSEWAGASPTHWQQAVPAGHIQETKEPCSAWSLSNSGMS